MFHTIQKNRLHLCFSYSFESVIKLPGKSDGVCREKIGRVEKDLSVMIKLTIYFVPQNWKVLTWYSHLKAVWSFTVSCSYCKHRTSRGQMFQFLRYLVLKWDEPPPVSSCVCVCIWKYPQFLRPAAYSGCPLAPYEVINMCRPCSVTHIYYEGSRNWNSPQVLDMASQDTRTR